MTTSPTPLEESLIVAAAGHLAAARLIARDQGEHAFNGAMSASMHLLIGNALELCLKAAFLAHGGQERELKAGADGIGHNLLSAYSKSIGRGFEPCDPRTRWLAEKLHESHLNHYFRYLGFGSLDLPDHEISLEILENIVPQVMSIIFGRDFSAPTAQK